MNQGSSAYGTISYNSLTDFAANQANRASITGQLPVNGLRKRQFFGYIQDEFKWRPTFTLNLGLPTAISVFFHEVQGRGNPFDFATCGPQGYCGVGASFSPSNYGDFAPRISFAWARPNTGERPLFAPALEFTTKTANWTIRTSLTRTRC